MARYFKSRDEARAYLNTLPLAQLIEVATDALLEVQPSSSRRITITEEQFKRYFRIQGINTETGEAETRGRKKKEPENDGLFNG